MTDLFQTHCPCCGQKMPEQKSASFAEFWSQVPNKVAKAPCEKTWKRMTPADRQAATDGLGPFYDWFKRTYPTASPLHPSTYLNQRRWEDEAIAPQDTTSSNDVLTHYAKQFKEQEPMPSYAIPSNNIIGQLLEAGLITQEDLRRHQI